MSCAMRKCVFGHMWTVKAQISRRIRSLIRAFIVNTESLDTTECTNEKPSSRWYFGHVQDGVNPYITCACGKAFFLTRDLVHNWPAGRYWPMVLCRPPSTCPWIWGQTQGLTLVLLNRDRSCLCKQCRSRSVGFWRSQLIWICTVCH